MLDNYLSTAEDGINEMLYFQIGNTRSLGFIQIIQLLCVCVQFISYNLHPKTHGHTDLPALQSYQYQLFKTMSYYLSVIVSIYLR